MQQHYGLPKGTRPRQINICSSEQVIDQLRLSMLNIHLQCICIKANTQGQHWTYFNKFSVKISTNNRNSDKIDVGGIYEKNGKITKVILKE